MTETIKTAKRLTDLIGNTPLLELVNYNKKHDLEATIAAKLEYMNPAGSVKDRAAYRMIVDAEERGLLKEGSVIIEPTSGNTGIGLAMVAASRGYRVILTMPATMSVERRGLLKAYGAELVLTDAALGMTGAIEKALTLAKNTPNSFMPGQFENPANSLAHFESTGPEIWRDTNGTVDILVAGVGTGGTITGCGKYLKAQNPAIEIFAVEPEGSAVLSGKEPGSHGLQGIGAGFIPKVLDTDIYNGIITVTKEEAFTAARNLAAAEGLLVGISSGAAFVAATRLAMRLENKNKLIVVILPDNGERYLSTPLYQE